MSMYHNEKVFPLKKDIHFGKRLLTEGNTNNTSRTIMATYLENMRRHFQANNRVKEEKRVHAAKVHSVDWSCDGRRLASGSFDKTVNVFLLERDRLNKDITFRGHGDSVDQLCWHPTNPDQLVTASENINICWSPDGSTIAVGNKDDLITFIDVKSHRSRAEEQFKFEINEISWNTDGDLFFLTSGKYFATGSADALVSLWDTIELVCVRTFSRLDWPVRTLSFSYDGKMLASASEDLVIDIAEVESGEKISEIACESPTFTVAWHPKRHLLAYACDDKYERDRDAGNVKVYGFPNSSDNSMFAY
ncbi:hypothetical protein KUTeg_019987, partial [Tegillarca granosa]